MKNSKNRFPEESQLLAQIPVALRTLRINAKLRQEDVAAMLKVSRSTYSYYEAGVTTPNPASLYLLSRFYRVPTDTFFVPGAVGPLFPSTQRVK